jgi:hypothetical protein
MSVLSKLALCFSLLLLAGRCLAEGEPENKAPDGRVQLYIRAEHPEGGKLFFLWRQIEGATVKIADPRACKLAPDGDKKYWVSDTYFVATDPGIYKFEVSVKNEDDEEQKRVFQFEVRAASPAPVAVAGKDLEKKVGEVVVFNGIGSSAAEGRVIKEWKWRVIKAPEKFHIDPKKLAERQFDFKIEEPGAYQFELTVFDGKKWSESSRVTLTARPKSAMAIIDGPKVTEQEVEIDTHNPVAVKTPRLQAVAAKGRALKPGETIVLDGRETRVEGDLKPSFMWEQKKGPLLQPLTPDKDQPFSPDRKRELFAFPVWTGKPVDPGEYVFVLRVEARVKGKAEPLVSVSDDVVFTVAGETPKPVAIVTAEKREVEAGELVKLSGAQSKGDNLQYLWGHVPGKKFPKRWTGEAGPEVAFTADEEGEYGVALVVTDGVSRSEPAAVTITVSSANQPPTVELQPAYEAELHTELHIIPKIKDPEQDRVEVVWICVEPKDVTIPDNLAKEPELVFVPRKKSVYIFKIVVSDAKGRKVSAQTQVGVKDSVNLAPAAVLDGPKSVPLGKKVRISGERSSDPEKKPLTYNWKIEDGSLKIPGGSPNETHKVWEFTPTEAGVYRVSLTVFDGVQKSEPTLFEVSVVRDNSAPVAAIAGPPNDGLELNQKAVLDGTGSSDEDEKDNLTYTWRKLNGTGDVELAGTDKPKCEVTGTRPGNVQVELVVNDGTVDSKPAIISLVVGKANTPPVAVISGPAAAKVGDLIDISGKKSSDPDGQEITTYKWSQPEDGGPKINLEGGAARKPELRFKIEKPGAYVLNLQVVDSEGAKSEIVSHKIEVKGVNKTPTAVASRADNEAVIAGQEVKLLSRGSLDPEGGPLTFQWKQLAGPALEIPNAAAEVLNLSPKEAGEYVFELVVSDGENESLPSKTDFVVRPRNTAPTARIASVTACEPGGKIILDGSASSDPDNDKLEYRWTKVSGPDASWPFRGDRKSKVEVGLPKEGEYVFELKVFDGKEWSAPQSAAVKTRAQNVAPQAILVSPKNSGAISTEENTETVLDASASIDTDNGPKPLTFTWKQIEGARLELKTDGALARFTPKRAGSFGFEVKAFDGKDYSAPTAVKVTVLKAGTLPKAVIKATPPNPVKASQGRNDPNYLILNGLESTPGAVAAGARPPALTYLWKQVGGIDLELAADKHMTDPRVGILIYFSGDYRFSLTVSDGTHTSLPAYIDIKVIDGSPPSAPAPAPKDIKEPKETKEPKPAPKPEQPNEESKLKNTAPDNDTSVDGALLPPPKSGAAAKNEAAKSVAKIEVTPSDKENYKKQLDELASSQDPQAEKALIDALSDADSEVRSTAAASLYRRGINSIPGLIGVLEHGDLLARREALWALKELTHENIGQDAAKWKEWWTRQQPPKSAAETAVKAGVEK